MSVRISEIDREFITRKKRNLVFISLKEEHFSVSGVSLNSDGNSFTRLSGNLLEFTRGINKRICHTAGGQIRFKTNSKFLELRLVLKNIEAMPWQTRCGAAGVDLYIGSGKDKQWFHTKAASCFRNRINTSINLPNFNGDDIKEITINLPLYSEVKKIDLGLDASALIDYAPDFEISNPIVFYGSSITQGCAAGRPGTSFPSLVSGFFNANYINLGFSSSAHGEPEMAYSISQIEMSAFVMEYDHNATLETLRNTHFHFYETVRKRHPSIPIIVLSRCSGGLSVSESETEKRKNIICNTVRKGEEALDRKLCFIDGNNIIPKDIRQNCFVDGVHPNDYGMNLIANAIIQKLEHISFGGN